MGCYVANHVFFLVCFEEQQQQQQQPISMGEAKATTDLGSFIEISGGHILWGSSSKL